MKTRFIWNLAKARRNLRDHGISFEEATEVFSDPHQVASENYYVAEDGEQRFQIIGMSAAVTLLPVVFVGRSAGDEETIRIVSARRAVKYEEAIYNDQFQ